MTAELTKAALFTPCGYTCPLKGGGQGQLRQGAPARDQGESGELATGKRNPEAPLGPTLSQEKAKDVGKKKTDLPLISPLSQPGALILSLISAPFATTLCFGLLLFKK